MKDFSFPLHSREYMEMTKDLKIFVFSGGNIHGLKGKYPSVDLFLKNLQDSEFLTSSQKDANFYVTQTIIQVYEFYFNQFFFLLIQSA